MKRKTAKYLHICKNQRGKFFAAKRKSAAKPKETTRNFKKAGKKEKTKR